MNRRLLLFAGLPLAPTFELPGRQALIHQRLIHGRNNQPCMAK
jgi:hypothetical protein